MGDGEDDVREAVKETVKELSREFMQKVLLRNDKVLKKGIRFEKKRFKS